MATVEAEIAPAIRSKQGIRLEPLFKREDGSWQVASTLSFRNYHHRSRAATELAIDQPIAFHGWGVSGVGKRVDVEASGQAFWCYKEGRPMGSKIPLLEPPKYAVSHVDWEQVHSDYRFLENPSRLKEMWRATYPFHIIFPYNQDGKSLSNAVVTPAYDQDVASNTPVPTICVFWIEDPALKYLIKDMKHIMPTAQIGVSSLNDNQETPPFNTPELLDYLRKKKIGFYRTIIEDPLLEPLDIASSHSQFVIPLKGEEPLWKVKRRGSLSPEAFAKSTSFDIDYKTVASARVAARRESQDKNLDDKVFQSARMIRQWYFATLFRSLLHI